MKNTIVDFPRSMVGFLGIVLVVAGIIMVTMPARALPFESVFWGVIVALVGIRLLVFGIVKQRRAH